jgi:hypothetical protein
MKSVRKAFETLAIVLFICFILACRCSSDLLRLGKNPPTPYPTPVSTPGTTPTATPLNTYSTPQTNSNRSTLTGNRPATGTYTGSGINTTANKTGDFLVRIDSIDDKGAVKGYFEASNGLYGSTALTGGVDNNGKMGLFGKTAEGSGLIISATTSGDTIKANYIIGSKQNGMQKGEFTVTRR